VRTLAPDSCLPARSSASSLRSARQILMPNAANRFAAARPIPLAPPVITAARLAINAGCCGMVTAPLVVRHGWHRIDVLDGEHRVVFRPDLSGQMWRSKRYVDINTARPSNPRPRASAGAQETREQLGWTRANSIRDCGMQRHSCLADRGGWPALFTVA